MRSKGSWGNRSVDVTPFLENEYNLILFINYSYLMGYLNDVTDSKFEPSMSGLDCTRLTCPLGGGIHLCRWKVNILLLKNRLQHLVSLKLRLRIKKMQEGVFVKEKCFKSILKLIVATFQVKVSIITC